MDAEREKGVYAIYSLMLTNPRSSTGADDNERLLIAMTTRPADVQLSCMRPPKERERQFRPVLTDYERRKATPSQLKPLLSIPRPYMFLTAGDLKAFIAERDLELSGPLESERFRGATHFFTLSDVYFNRRRTLAVTGLSCFCGGLCGRSQWRVFEKLASGKWQELRWGLCAAIAENLGLGPETPVAPAGRPAAG